MKHQAEGKEHRLMKALHPRREGQHEAGRQERHHAEEPEHQRLGAQHAHQLNVAHGEQRHDDEPERQPRALNRQHRARKIVTELELERSGRVASNAESR